MNGATKYKYILFDFDGTVINSMPFLENNAVSLLKELGFTTEEAQLKYRETTGLPFIQQMEIIAPERDNRNIVSQFEEMKINNIYEQDPFPESEEVLLTLKKRGYMLGISSGTIEEIIIEYLQKKGLSHLVQDSLGWKPGFEKGKDHFEFIKLKYELISEEIVFIGDSLNDAKRAHTNTIHFIGRTGMFQLKDFQKILPETTVITSLTEVLDLFP